MCSLLRLRSCLSNNGCFHRVLLVILFARTTLPGFHPYHLVRFEELLRRDSVFRNLYEVSVAPFLGSYVDGQEWQFFIITICSANFEFLGTPFSSRYCNLIRNQMGTSPTSSNPVMLEVSQHEFCPLFI